jgi:hypothetical protein
MLHPSATSTMVEGFRLTKVKFLSHCIDVEKGFGDEMIPQLEAIMKTGSFAGINSNLHSLAITNYLSKW